MKVYAYVQSETCTGTRAVEPGAEVNGTPVSRHGDYLRWDYGKRATLNMIADQKCIGWKHRAACAVADLLGWR